MRPPVWPGLTLVDFGKQKGFSPLALDYLRVKFDVYETKYRNKDRTGGSAIPVVAIPYGHWVLDEWQPTSTHIRGGSSHQTIWDHSNHGKDRPAPADFSLVWPDYNGVYTWKEGEEYQPAPYGLCRFPVRLDPDDAYPKDVVICEGETDVHTLSLYSIPALGIAGATNWKKDFAQVNAIRNAERIFIVDEGGEAGRLFCEKVGNDLKDLLSAQVFVLRFPVKDPETGARYDPNEVHKQCLDKPRREPPFSIFTDPQEVLEDRRKMVESGEWNPRQNDPFLEAFDAAVADAQPFDPAIPKTEIEPFRYRATDKGNADRMVDMFGPDIRLLTDKGSYARWMPDKGVWMMEVKKQLLQPLAARMVATITPENTLIEEKEDVKWQRRSESYQRTTSMLAKLWDHEELYKHSNEFNLGLWKLNTQNCTINLETQQPYEWVREDYLTLQAPVFYDPNAKCPQFDAFMQRTFGGDKDLIHWMLKAMGYTMTGDIGEQCFFVCLGPGGTGKSTLLMILCNLLGDGYSEPADLAIFDRSSRKLASAQSYEMATYPNKHYVFASEPEGGASCTFEEGMIKKLTGSEKQKARQIYAVPGKFTPRLKLWFSMNHRPHYDTTDDAMLRRLLIIPFENQLEVGSKDDIQNLADKMVKQEASGILNRLLEGLHDWTGESLDKTNLPLAIRKASGEYWQGKHVLSQFFAERTTRGDASLWERAGFLHAAYRLWAKEGNIYPVDGKSFAAEMRARGFLDKRGDNSLEKGSGTLWHGLRLNEPYRQQAVEAAKGQPEPDEDEKT